MLEGNISLIVEQLLEFHHKDMVIKQFRNYNEAAFQVAVAKLFPSKIGECENMCRGISNIVLELKYISLLGLYSGEEGKWKGDIDYKTMLNLDNTLKEESEFDLLERIYYHWCKENKSYKATKIRKIVNSGIDQVQRYISLLNKASVDDCNVELISPGLGTIGGVQGEVDAEHGFKNSF
ncbi:14418_t:CDS:2, partial [Funneliformis geosporum]